MASEWARPRWERWADVVLVFLTALAVPVVVWVLGVAGRSFYHQVLLMPGLEERYGFELDTPYVGDPGCRTEVIQFSVVESDGPFAGAGIRPGDILRPGRHGGITELCILLHDLEPGDSIALRVRTFQDAGCLRDWPERIVTIVAP